MHDKNIGYKSVCKTSFAMGDSRAMSALLRNAAARDIIFKFLDDEALRYIDDAFLFGTLLSKPPGMGDVPEWVVFGMKASAVLELWTQNAADCATFDNMLVAFNRGIPPISADSLINSLRQIGAIS